MLTEKEKRKKMEYRRKLLFGNDWKKVFERDNYTCQRCGMTNKEHIKKWGRHISLHHIDGKGKNAKEKNNSMNNLITFCISCHGVIDTHRIVLKGTHNNVKLTPDKIREIRKLRNDKHLIYSAISKMYGVCNTTIIYIINGRSWSWVK